MDNRQFWARMQAQAFLQSEERYNAELLKRINKAIELLKQDADKEQVIAVLEGKIP